jgi:hypothetical protein
MKSNSLLVLFATFVSDPPNLYARPHELKKIATPRPAIAKKKYTAGA